jgi:hypothetical protein
MCVTSYRTEHLRVATIFPLHRHAPCTKFQSKYCDTYNGSYLSDKCYQNRLTLTVNSKLVCECRTVCRNCSLFWLQILSSKVSSHSAISVTISSHQSVFATWLHSSPVRFHKDLCTFFDKECTQVLEQRDGYFEQHRTVYVLSKCVQGVKQLGTRILIVNVWHTCSRVPAGRYGKIYFRG